jgi:hypothetical protein
LLDVGVYFNSFASQVLLKYPKRWKSLGHTLPKEGHPSNDWEIMDHRPYTPDLSLSNVHLFGPLKQNTAGKRFATHGFVKQPVTSWLNTQQ